MKKVFFKIRFFVNGSDIYIYFLDRSSQIGFNVLSVMISAVCLGSASVAFALSTEDIPIIADIAISSKESIQNAVIDSACVIHAAALDNSPVLDANIVPTSYLESKIAASTTAAKAVDINWRYFLSGAACASFSHGVSVPCRC